MLTTACRPGLRSAHVLVGFVEQGEGGEQGDPLMPLLYALAQHRALENAKEGLHSDDLLVAFLSQERTQGCTAIIDGTTATTSRIVLLR